MKEAWVAGEALIDLYPNLDLSRKPFVGGGALNTAKALSRLGRRTQFIGGISSDLFGREILADLEYNSIEVDHIHLSELPTATSEIEVIQNGSARYSFTLEGTATFSFNQHWLPEGEPEVLHIGSLSTIIEPGAQALFNWAKSLDTRIVFDPNVRLSVEIDAMTYRNRIKNWVTISDILKLSEEDCDFLYGNLDDKRELLDLGPSLIVLTKGASGISAFSRHESVFVPGYIIDVVDTVGAGDTVGAILVESMFDNGFTGLVANLESVLRRATKAAAITCSRAGANPPWRKELDQA
jgi:fructokinase